MRAMQIERLPDPETLQTLQETFDSLPTCQTGEEADMYATQDAKRDLLLSLGRHSVIGRGQEATVAVMRCDRVVGSPCVAVKVRRACEPDNDGGCATATELKAMMATRRLLVHSPALAVMLDHFCASSNLTGSPAPSQYLVMEWCEGGDFADFAEAHPQLAMAPDFLRVVLFHLIFAIATVQRGLRMTLYDVHDRNVLLAASEPSLTHMRFTVDNVQFFIPNIGCVPKIVDLSFAHSVQAGCTRSDLDDPGLMEEEPENPKGTFTGGIECAFKPYYDIVTLGSFLKIMADEKNLVLPSEVRRFIDETMLAGQDFVGNAGRPGPGMVVDTSPEQCLSDPFFEELRAPREGPFRAYRPI
jgi:hypothetical protein